MVSRLLLKHEYGNLYILLTIAAIVISILNTILFFKIWGMCNNIKTIRTIMIENVIRQHYNPDKIIEEFREGDLVFDKKINYIVLKKLQMMANFFVHALKIKKKLFLIAKT